MTTGRINQVTIFAASPPPESERLAVPTPVDGGGMSRKVGGSSRDWSPGPGAFRGRSRRKALKPIQLPPLNSPRGGPPQRRRGIDPGPTPSRCNIRLSKGGCQPLVTSEDGYELRLTPDCLRDNDSHRPIIHRLLQCPRAHWPRDFRPPSSGRDAFEARPGAFLEGPATVGWGDTSPEPEPGRERKATRAVSNYSAHG